MNTFIDWIFAADDYCKSHKAKAVYRYIENNTLQDPFYTQVIKPIIYSKNKERSTSVYLLGDSRKKGGKYTRVEAKLEPLNRNGLLILNIAEKDNPHMQRCEAQFKAASPNSKIMDAPDTIEGAVTIIDEKANLKSATNIIAPKRKRTNKRM
jgi:hypothetical protein